MMEDSCARTRCWTADNINTNRYKAASVDREAANSGTDMSEDWSELQVSSKSLASMPSDTELAGPADMAEGPRVLEAANAVDKGPVALATPRDSSVWSSKNSKEDRAEDGNNDKVGSTERSDKKSSHRKHKSSSRHKKEKDEGSRRSRHNEKIRENSDSEERGAKRKTEDSSTARQSHKRDRKAHKDDKKSDDEYSYRQDRKREYLAKDDGRSSSRIDRRKEHKRSNFDDTSDDEYYQWRERGRDSSKMYHPSNIARERHTKRADRDHRWDMSRSRSPKSHKHPSYSHSKRPGRSPSPREKQEKETIEQDKKENEGRAFSSHLENSISRHFENKTSGLGGYSPRRRRSDAATKTPSPPPRSPERRKARAWDLPPAGMDSGIAAAMAAAQQAANQQAVALASASSLASVNSLLSNPAAASPMNISTVSLIPSLLTQVNPAVTAVTLTQSTRPLRRLYIANVPSTVSDGELMEFLNMVMLSANVNHLPGTKPCISCVVYAEKNYAFSEFLTPEDATAALAFDGVTLHGTTLKIRRPKDYVQPANGVLEKLPFAVDMVSSIVLDSPRKVFVGGICPSLSSDKVKEIVTAFGRLKAYHWQVSVQNGQKKAFAFLEYLDPLVTHKACAGLNGMRLGKSILTVAQATPDVNDEDGCAGNQFYGIPEHVKPLLETPTRILELQNLIREEELSAMSEDELNEFKEDIRLECLRFGTVKSMHIVMPIGKEMDSENGKAENPYGTDASTIFDLNVKENHGGDKTVAEASSMKSIEVKDLLENALNETCSRFGNIVTGIEESRLVEANEENGESIIQQPFNENKVTNDNMVTEEETSSNPDAEKNKCLGQGINEKLVEKQGNSLNQRQSEPGTVYIEYAREEYTCQAAHNLHGRIYGEQKVVAGYFSLRLYQKRFRKGLEPQTDEEKQLLALAAHEHLCSYIKD